MKDKDKKALEMSEDDSPENYCVREITRILTDMDGMTTCMALGILDCVRLNIYEIVCVGSPEEGR